MSKLKSRKFIGMLIGIIILTASMITFAVLSETAITANSVIVYMILVVFLITAYIGGNIFHAFVASKFFKKEKEDEK